jgi:valyl-tRNA synthetase
MELPKAYDFQSVEARLYRWWEEQGFFTPEIDPERAPYVISMPPPNVTGELHLGHAMFVAMEDLMIRFNRMKGTPTLWLPGTDHAGIATQLQVEKHLLRTEEVTREEMGREAFVQKTWDWKHKYGDVITDQLRRLGASCDWSRERFTLDEGLSKAVREAFVRLYEKELIYRGSYLINWSPGLRTAVSDLEVEYSEEEGTMYYFKYPVAGSDEFIPVATTRPETILGDTAVAVHPDDERFRHLIGKTCLVPILKRPIPIIHDTYVDLEFGTGALKITPGHDPADYEIGQRHGLAIINVLNEDATMNDEAGPYAGMDRFACRDKLWDDMQKEGLTLKTESYALQVPRSQRGGEVVEPMVSTQWFVRMEPLASAGLQAVRDGRIQIVPERFTKVYYNWLENIRDWCISRQLWWGHRIPAWHCADCAEITVAREDPDRCNHCGSNQITQDPDVLDTWFSSGLWPFSTLGWPDQTHDLEYFYPTTMMETGYDILFFWVARMIMMALEFTDDIPFQTVYLHGLVRVESGHKMSKTLENVIDPIELMREFGTDALRFTLLTGSTPGVDMKLSLDRLTANRNFANKIWNAGRFVLHHLSQATGESTPQEEDRTLADRWILGRLETLKADVYRLFEAHQYGEAGRQMYEFFWTEFADWYVEIAKLQLRQTGSRASRTRTLLAQVFDESLRMLHPFIPFVTEELWGTLKRTCQASKGAYRPDGGWEEALIVAAWPMPTPMDPSCKQDLQKFGLLQALITSIRNVRAENEVEQNQRIAVVIQTGSEAAWLREERDIISTLAKVDPEQLSVEHQIDSPPKESIPLVVGPLEVYLPLTNLVDIERERERLEAEAQQISNQINRLKKLLEGPFTERAPAEIVQKEKDRLAALQETAAKLDDQLRALG